MLLKQIGKRLLACVTVSALVVAGSASAAGIAYNIVTSTENGTYPLIGKDLANHIAPAAGIELQPLFSKGSVENIKRLRDEPGTKLALVQADVYQAYKDQAARGNAEAARLIRPLRVVLPLYDEEVYVITRADSPLQYISQIQNLRINIGPIGSGSAMTATTLYRAMFKVPMADDKVSTLSNEDALLQLVKDKNLDAVIVVAGQPTTLFLGMEPGVEKYFKLLKADNSPALTAALNTYSKSTIRATSYPNWLKEDHPSVSVKSLLVTFDYNLVHTRQALAGFAKSLCANFDTLQARGHPKWREVSLRLPPLSAGWSYYGPTSQELGRCVASAARQTPAASANCALPDKVMGLCS
ncbi:MAG: TAXI family TRAP transporter solute-binding subunit [Pseudomonadota bacterium]